ncbi:MAG TPA: hemerythrin domain-containing protein [Alphaproteobacteria bacterium]|jgi:hemerythrin-like domain-containing protein
MLAAPSAKHVSRRQPPAFEPLDLRLLARPLDFLLAEHYRLRAALTQLDWLARGSVGESRRKLARALARYFAEDFALHTADEETDFFPLLRARCADDEAFLATLDTLAAEHRADDARLAEVVASLENVAEGPLRVDLPPEFAAETRAFIEALRRHIAWENAVLLPVARGRLQSADLRRLAQKLAARRNVTLAAAARTSATRA